jgi:membrane-associated protein
MHQILDIFLHLDKVLNAQAAAMGSWVYVLLFGIVFCETGLVVTPFLPGDSLLFAVGTLAAMDGSPLSLVPIMVLLFVAAVLGDAVNYSIGSRVGPRAFRSETSFFFNKKHLLRTQAFYELHGGKTIILARFMPIVRTFAPFVAGVGKMPYSRFGLFNIVGAAAWVGSFTLAGYKFAGAEIVKKNFHIVVFAIIFISILPGVIEYLRARGRTKNEKSSASAKDDAAVKSSVAPSQDA